MKKFILVLGMMIVAGTYVYGMKYFYAEPVIVNSKKEQPKLSQEDKIRNVVKRHLNEIQECYNQRLEQGLNREGKLKISWEIDENGVPSNFAEENNQLNDAELFDCSSQSMSEWQFPKGIPFKINYTFNLSEKVSQKGRKAASIKD